MKNYGIVLKKYMFDEPSGDIRNSDEIRVSELVAK